MFKIMGATGYENTHQKLSGKDIGCHLKKLELEKFFSHHWDKC